ncbi:MAG: ABC transporter substrate-binding protein [Candidatus Hodarchaeales archaeon]
MKFNIFFSIILIHLLLFSYFSDYQEYPFNPTNSELASSYEPRKIENQLIKSLQVRKSASLPSILKIGAVTPSYYLSNYEPHFDPLTLGWSYDIQRNSLIYEALVQYDHNTGKLSPALATQWVVSEDGKHWTFYLRENVLFHDGSKFNASSVKFNYERLIDPSHPAFVVPAPYISLTTIPFDSIEIDNEYQITIHLKTPFGAFIQECPYIQIVSPKSFDGSEVVVPIGTGSYKFDLLSSFSNETIQNYTFIRFPDYYQGLAPFEQINYISAEDLGDEIYANSLDLILLNNKLYKHLQTDDYWTLNISNEVNSFEVGYFNHQNEYLSDPRVRLAINYAIDRLDYITRLNRTEFSQPMINLIPPGVLFYDESIKGYPYNVILANEILDKAGYPRGNDNYRFFLKLSGPENRYPEIIGEYLKAIGIYPWIDYPTDWGEIWREGNYDILLFGSTVFYDPDLCRLYINSSSPFNTGKFEDARLDKLIIRGTNTPVPQERENVYYKLQPLIQESAPYIYLTYSSNIFATATDLTPFLFVNKLKQLDFNYSSSSNSSVSLRHKIDPLAENGQIHQINEIFPDEFVYKNVELAEYPIYFPFSDNIVTPLDHQELIVNITMSHNLKTFLPSQEESGKFIRISSNREDGELKIRFYYDVNEVQGISQKQLSLFKYNESENFWEELNILSSNSITRYLEVELKGSESLIRFGRTLIIKTFRLVPFFVIAISGIIVSAISVVIYNSMKRKYIKGRILD